MVDALKIYIGFINAYWLGLQRAIWFPFPFFRWRSVGVHIHLRGDWGVGSVRIRRSLHLTWDLHRISQRRIYDGVANEFIEFSSLQ
ncbi:hypothetical protein SCHPADRAFT_415774 [Schizopora paradoxa]|uniref:Uncharacterized protein n=1 Tax=Schizopora paradoxa TaxID=27342 RepID=A0A0H2RKR2_9AGAM|nr:hypothetical protein SCHPADRAFT_415774 [Schizopora paradoxa]